MIKNWLVARAICKRNGIKLKFKRGTYSAFARWNGFMGVREIHISPLHKPFMQSFLHELSHIRSFDRMANRGLDVADEMDDPVKKFKEETKAWIFTKRVLKSKYDSNESARCLMSYSRVHYYEALTPDQIVPYTDNLVKCMNRV